MNTKLVTAYYPIHQGPPFWGKQGRDRWYKYSLASICNMGAPVVCYTDNQSLSELNQIKEDRKLDNLIIKLYNLETNPFQRRIYNTRISYPELYNNESHPFYKMPFTIYWMKWNFLHMEYEPDTYLYWIDGGLSAAGLFPARATSYGKEPGYADEYRNDRDNYMTKHEFKFYTFDNAFNPKRLKLINNYTEGKILNLCMQNNTDNDFYKFEDKLDLERGKIMGTNKFPVGAMFGGNSPHLLDYINMFNETAEKILSLNDYLCTEQEIMGYIHAEHPEWFKDWVFDTFYHEDWKLNSDGELKPYKELFANSTAFSSFFLDDLPLEKDKTSANILKKSLGNK